MMARRVAHTHTRDYAKKGSRTHSHTQCIISFGSLARLLTSVPSANRVFGAIEIQHSELKIC